MNWSGRTTRTSSRGAVDSFIPELPIPTSTSNQQAWTRGGRTTRTPSWGGGGCQRTTGSYGTRATASATFSKTWQPCRCAAPMCVPSVQRVHVLWDQGCGVRTSCENVAAVQVCGLHFAPLAQRLCLLLLCCARVCHTCTDKSGARVSEPSHTQAPPPPHTRTRTLTCKTCSTHLLCAIRPPLSGGHMRTLTCETRKTHPLCAV